MGVGDTCHGPYVFTRRYEQFTCVSVQGPPKVFTVVCKERRRVDVVL